MSSEQKPLNVLMLTTEMVPWVKTGGLADVLGALSQELVALGTNVHVCMPKYDQFLEPLQTSLEKVPEQCLQFKVHLGWREELVALETWRSKQGLLIHFLDAPKYFARPEVYGDERGDYPDNAERFSLFCYGALEMLKHLQWKPDVLHCHDWQTGLVPVYLRQTKAYDPFYSGMRTLFTVHNLAYQGVFAPEFLFHMGLGDELFHPEALEYHGRVSFMKGGLIFSDRLNTVSPRYCLETQSEEFGCGLEGILRSRKNVYSGVLNGIDETIWDPANDSLIAAQYDIDRLEQKSQNKQALQKLCGFALEPRSPVLGMVTRLAKQKGLDWLIKATGHLQNLPLQIVLLGQGDQHYAELLQEWANQASGKVQIKLFLKHDEALAHQIYAGADMFLMPSMFEPCGLGQMIALKYGAVPLVNPVGGLADTVLPWEDKELEGHGLVMESPDAAGLEQMIVKALKLFDNQKHWTILQKNGMIGDYSWRASARKYLKLYEQL